MKSILQKKMEAKAKKLAEKFYADAQKLFDHDDMTLDIAEDYVFSYLQMAQGSAEECYELADD